MECTRKKLKQHMNYIDILYVMECTFFDKKVNLTFLLIGQ